MTEIVLTDMDDLLLDRIRQVAGRSGWSLSTTVSHLLEQGLRSYEGTGEVRFEGGEADVLQAALEALSEVPSDPGFAMIGRVRMAAAEG